MARPDKHDSNNPSVRGGSRKAEMDLKRKLHKQSGGRPARLKSLLAEEAAAEMELIEKRIAEEAKAAAEEAAAEVVAEEAEPKRKPRKKKEE